MAPSSAYDDPHHLHDSSSLYIPLSAASPPPPPSATSHHYSISIPASSSSHPPLPRSVRTFLLPFFFFSLLLLLLLLPLFRLLPLPTSHDPPPYFPFLFLLHSRIHGADPPLYRSLPLSVDRASNLSDNGMELPNLHAELYNWRMHPHYQPSRKFLSVLSNSDGGPWDNSQRKSLRTAFHFQPENNWMNDPNAPLYYDGWYHLFYQYNPNDAFWGLISWGHAVSVDLIHWLYLDMAMEPDEWYDRSGVWSGSATFTADGLPVIMYTGSTNDSVQVQNMAYPADPTDILLRKWTKVPQNPILRPPSGILPTDFRDPTTAWRGSDGVWRVGIGAKVNRTGVALIYETSDFVQWNLRENYLHSVPGTGMWECLDFYPIFANGSSRGVDTSVYGEEVKHVIKASMDDSKKDFYTIGKYDSSNHTFTPDVSDSDLGQERSLRYDYGKFYASKSFYDESTERRILWGWINESDSVQDDIRKGWASVLALPRQVWLDNLTQSNLLQWPIEEFSSLRGSETSVENLILEPGSSYEIPDGTGAQWDIELTIDNPTSTMALSGMELKIDNVEEEPEIRSCAEASAAKNGYLGPFGLLVLASNDLEEQTAAYFYLTRRNVDGKWAALVCNDETRSTKAMEVDKNIYGAFVPVMENETTLSLRVVVDHSIVETYAQGGRVCITSRVYPTKALEQSAKLFLFNNATASPITVRSLRAWPISRVNMHPFVSSLESVAEK